MEFVIDWHFFLGVTNQQKCDKIIQEISDALGTGFFEISSERYWKEKTLFKVDAKSSFQALNSRDSLYMTMNLIKRLARSWNVTMPPDEGPWEFGGVSSSGSVQIIGVNSIFFNVSQIQKKGLAEAS